MYFLSRKTECTANGRVVDRSSSYHISKFVKINTRSSPQIHLVLCQDHSSVLMVQLLKTCLSSFAPLTLKARDAGRATPFSNGDQLSTVVASVTQTRSFTEGTQYVAS